MQYVWYPRGNSIYHIGLNHFLHWSDARKFCQDRGGDLAIIKSAEDNKFISDLVSQYNLAWHTWISKSTDVTAWLGLHRKDDSKFYWVDDTPLLDWQYSEWKLGQPDNEGGVEKCAHMVDGGKWNDLSWAPW